MRCGSLYDHPIFRMVMMNAASDVLWAYFSAANLNIKFEHSTDNDYSPNGQLTAQLIYPTLAAAFCASFMLLAYKKYGSQKESSSLEISEVPTLNTGDSAVINVDVLDGAQACIQVPAASVTVEILALLVVTPMVIAAWNFAQPKAVEFFMKSIDCSKESAGYLSSMATGVTEGSIAYLLPKLIKLFADPNEYSAFRNNSQRYLLDAFVQLGLNSTIGGFSGAVWQLVFNGMTIGNVNPALIALVVVFSAGLVTTGSMYGINKITHFDCYQKQLLNSCTAVTKGNTKYEAPFKSFAALLSDWVSRGKSKIFANIDATRTESAVSEASESLLSVTPPESVAASRQPSVGNPEPLSLNNDYLAPQYQ